MKKVGITGGIGSGKTTVCGVWEKLGAHVLFADDLAKKLMMSDQNVKEQIIAAFGEDSYHQNGELNRPYLAKKAFEQGRVEELNQIVHPAVYKKTAELMEKAELENCPVFVKEAALLLKNGRPDHFDIIVMVTAPENKRVERVTQRDQTKSEEVRSRVQKQQNFDELRHLADYIIENNGTMNELIQKARDVYAKITS